MQTQVGDGRSDIYDQFPNNPGKIMIRESIERDAVFLQNWSCILLPVADIVPSQLLLATPELEWPQPRYSSSQGYLQVRGDKALLEH
jgi:hypothetical protein